VITGDRPDRGWRITDAVLAVVAGFLLSGVVQVAFGRGITSSQIFRFVVPVEGGE
jgi:hypothetical protein